VFLGGNTILIGLLVVVAVVVGQALVNYYRKKQKLKRKVRNVLRGGASHLWEDS